MIRNFFKIAFRNLRKNKIFSLINILGLAFGITCFLLIAAYVYSELNYDKYPQEAGNIYRVKLSLTGNGEVAVYPHVDMGVGEGMKAAFPEIKSFTRIIQAGPNFVRYNDRQFKEEHLAYTDSGFLQTFTIPLLEGNASNALASPNSVVVSRSFARKYFGVESVVGKSLVMGKNEILNITGVFEKIPENSHFHFDALISLSTLRIIHPTWSNVGTYTYLVLNKNTDVKKLESKFPRLVAQFVVPEIQHDMGVSLAEAQKSVSTFIFSLEPLTDIHLRSNSKYELEPNGDIQYVYIFAALAIFILLLACINFTNLSTASAVKRSREVGIRKVLGSMKNQLVTQFLTESVLITFLATLCSFGLILLVLPYFNELAGKHLDFGFFTEYRTIIFVALLCLGVGVLAGIYPSFILSSFNTIQVLKGSSGNKTKTSSLRSGLVIFQFFVSTTLIIATIIVYQQLHYMQTKKLGYNKDLVLYLPDTYLLGNRQDVFRQNLLNDNRVAAVSIGRTVPGSANMDGTEIYPLNEKGSGAEIHANIYHVDYDFLETLGIPVVRGRNFSKSFPTDTAGVLINEAAVRQLGWNGVDPLNRSIMRSGQKVFKVVGVIQDFHYASLKQKIAPLMLLLGNNYGGMIVKIKPGNTNQLLADMKNQWDLLNPGGPFEYNFLDEKYTSLYASEQSTGRIFTSFTVIAILIAGLGLFGLAAFITEQRTKEIGIRKVLGASVQQLLILVSKDFLILVLIAFFISIPVTWWAMHNWLQDFAYRVPIHVWIFPMAGIAAILIAVVTIGFQAIRASIANPVNSLRSE